MFSVLDSHPKEHNEKYYKGMTIFYQKPYNFILSMYYKEMLKQTTFCSDLHSYLKEKRRDAKFI